MDERDMTLLRSFDFMRDISGWFWSEKLDGCRAYWDGSRFWTRGGEVITVPDRIAQRMPKGVHVDGEIWAGRGGFQRARVAVQNNIWEEPPHPGPLPHLMAEREKTQIDFWAFDFPQIGGTWDQRMNAGKIFGLNQVEFGIVNCFEALGRIYQTVVNAGGEGLVVRNPCVKSYERKRTQNCLRIKDVV